MTIERYRKKNIDAKVIVVVPSEVLQVQWKEELSLRKLDDCDVFIINTIIKQNYVCDLLIIDEVHRCGAQEFRKVFNCVDYKRLLCLTATMQRLDGLERIIEHYAPVCDEITLKECLLHGWVAEYQEYKVVLEVDLTSYQRINTEFTRHFSVLGYSLPMLLSCVSSPGQRRILALQLGISVSQVSAHTFAAIRLLKERKSWVMNHPKKTEIAKKIMSFRQDKKVLTFSSSINLANSLGNGYIVHSKIPKKKRGAIIKQFSKDSEGVLHSVDSLREGMDVPGVSVAVITGFNSSMLKKIQTIGRVIRKEGDKKAEVFTLVIKDTIEERWFAKSSSKVGYTTIYEQDLDDLLNNTITEQKDVLYF